MTNLEKYNSIQVKRTKKGKEVLFVDGVMRRDIENWAEWLMEDAEEVDTNDKG